MNFRKISRIVAFGLFLVVAAWWWLSNHVPAHSEQKTAAKSSEKAPRTSVALSPEKLEAAGIEIVRAEKRAFQEEQLVPGRVQYDDTLHVEIKAASEGVLIQVLVKPGDRVETGTVLAVLSSPEIGTVRADVLKWRAEFELATRKLNWVKETHDNIQKFLTAIDQRVAISELETTFDGKKLGDHRDKLITAYSRYLVADASAKNAQTAADSGALSGKTLRERLGEKQTNEAALKGLLEQTKFDATHALEQATIDADDARRRLEISQQHRNALLGYEEANETSTNVSLSVQDTKLSYVESRAPFAGTIERKTFSKSERVHQGDTLFVLADTSRLWIAADIREREWAALSLSAGQVLQVEAPALPGKNWTARLHYLGREVLPATNAVPLVAAIENSDGLLRPGLFVHVTIPKGITREALCIPSSTLLEDENQHFVFVEESPGKYQRQDVKIGAQTREWVEVLTGLTPDAPLVSRGAFILKSELMLEAE